MTEMTAYPDVVPWAKAARKSPENRTMRSTRINERMPLPPLSASCSKRCNRASPQYQHEEKRLLPVSSPYLSEVPVGTDSLIAPNCVESSSVSSVHDEVYRS